MLLFKSNIFYITKKRLKFKKTILVKKLMSDFDKKLNDRPRWILWIKRDKKKTIKINLCYSSIYKNKIKWLKICQNYSFRLQWSLKVTSPFKISKLCE